MVKRIDPRLNAFLVDPLYHLKAILFCLLIAELYHFMELPGRIYVKKRERRLFRVKCFEGQMHHNGAVLADGIKHDRLLAFRRHLADDIDRLCLQSVQM